MANAEKPSFIENPVKNVAQNLGEKWRKSRWETKALVVGAMALFFVVA